jgi:glyoxylase-like metal-dependent hydrolase (beta-lactamase superfamily II)
VAREADVTLEKILVTHGHFDHVGAVGRMARELGLPIEGPHEDDRFLLDTLPQWCKQFGFPPCEAFVPERWLVEGDEVRFGDQVLKVHHCPGHTPGHVIFVHEHDGIAIVGDVIFQGSIGRTDFPRGDHQTLLNSIRQRIWPLGDEVTLLPGHGPTTTVAQERAHNPFLQGAYG